MWEFPGRRESPNITNYLDLEILKNAYEFAQFSIGMTNGVDHLHGYHGSEDRVFFIISVAGVGVIIS